MPPQRPTTDAARRFGRLALALAGVAVALGLAEAALRLAAPPAVRGPDEVDLTNLEAWRARVGERGVILAGQDHHPLYGWTNRPGLRDFVEPGHPPRSTNSAGMRGRTEFAPQPAPGRLRVALVGDSFTFGTHQPDDAIWARELERALPGSEVLNFGVPGFGIDQALLRLEHEVLAWRPDVVVFGIFATNPQRASRRFTFYAKPRFELGPDGRLLRPPAGQPVPEPGPLAGGQARLDLERGSASGWALARVFTHGLASDGPFADGAPDHADLRALTAAILTEAQDLCAEAGAELLVLNIPTLRWRELERAPWEAALDTRDAPAQLDARAVFDAALEDGAGALYVPGRHFSPEGHRRLGRAVAERLAELGWQRPTRRP